ncbi:MAG TPA: helix-turn-helix transcriptional regulator [Candidatus Elarobacter sp.]|nr:helix-turn-helix transcriptional regulator [Candidatus Elarobacter sp.]
MADALPTRDAIDVVESVLLRARALLALDRAEEALAALRVLRLVERPRDEYLTAQMLTAVAFSKLEQGARAVEMLREAHASASSAHPTVRAEIALHLGIVHFCRSEHEEAARFLAEVPPEADIVYAQALKYRAWIAYASCEYESAATLFDDALSTIPRCRHYDRFVDATTLFGLARLAAELPRLDRWPDITARMSSIDWSAPGLNVSHFWLAAMASIIEEMRGERDEAIRWASIAEDVAPTATSRVAAACRLAAATGRYGEAYAHRYFVRKARRMYDQLPRDGAFRAELFLALTVAEEIAAGDAPLDAAPLLIYHREVVEPLVRRRPEHGMLTAVRDAVEARLEHARGNRAGAVRRYNRAFDAFVRMGYRRRASIVAYRLAELTGDARYREYADDALRDAGDAYWVKAAFARLGMGEVRLGERHTAILRLVAEGRTNKEIGAVRGISALTARNAVRELLRIFGATNRTELGRMARERGIV